MSLFRDLFVTALFLILVGLIVVKLDEGAQEHLAGTVRVIDGDTIVLSSRRIRLSGIDAPELSQTCRRGADTWPCGAEARDFLVTLVARGVVDCTGSGQDRYDRLLAVCSVAGRSVNAAMVEGGYAMSSGAYGAEEVLAREARRGIWSGTFDRPRDWRRTHGALEEAGENPISGVGSYLEHMMEKIRAMFSGAGAR